MQKRDPDRPLTVENLSMPADAEPSLIGYIIKFARLLQDRQLLTEKSLSVLVDLARWDRQKDTLIEMMELYPPWPGFFEQLEQAQRLSLELQAVLGILPATGRALADALVFDQRYRYHLARTDTHEAAYEAVEAEYRQFFGKNRYSNYESYRRTYSRRVKTIQKRSTAPVSAAD